MRSSFVFVTCVLSSSVLTEGHERSFVRREAGEASQDPRVLAPSMEFSKTVDGDDATTTCMPGGSPGAALANGCYELGSRKYHVRVPASSWRPLPVLIVLHGNGGNGFTYAQQLPGKNLQFHGIKFIIVAPDGDNSSWNVVAEDSTMDDVQFVGVDLITEIASKTNVDPNWFVLYGHSNGAAMVNRLLIENDDPRIKAAITDRSQLNTFQFNNNNFYIGGSDNLYTTVKASLQKRRLLAISDVDDPTIPDQGGASTIDAHSGKLQMTSWSVSALQYAKAYGWTGTLPSIVDSTDHKSLRFPGSFTNMAVTAVDFKNCASSGCTPHPGCCHGSSMGSTSQESWIIDWLAGIDFPEPSR